MLPKILIGENDWVLRKSRNIYLPQLLRKNKNLTQKELFRQVCLQILKIELTDTEKRTNRNTSDEVRFVEPEAGHAEALPAAFGASDEDEVLRLLLPEPQRRLGQLPVVGRHQPAVGSEPATGGDARSRRRPVRRVTAEPVKRVHGPAVGRAGLRQVEAAAAEPDPIPPADPVSGVHFESPVE